MESLSYIFSRHSSEVPPKNNLKLLLFTSLGLLLCTDNHLKSCGIIGYIGNRDIAIEVLLQGLEEMQNRGYDSAGVVTYSDGSLKTTKYASSASNNSDSLKRLKSEVSISHKPSSIGLGHTRWATHGGKTDTNAHPHSDQSGRIALVHNGTITNTQEIYEILKSKGISPVSQTDTELIAQMIGLYLNEGHSLKLATRLALEKMNGTWGLAVISKDHPDQIVVARRGSPMLIGLGDKELFIGSEPAAFSKYTSKYISLEENQIFKIDPSKDKIEASKVRTIQEQASVSLGNYTHWTLKEIEEQPESISRAMNYGARLTIDSARLGGLEEIKEKFLQVKNLILLGCGTSLHACQFGAHLFSSLKLMNTVQAIDGSEMYLKSLPKQGAGIIAISQSGETRDVVTPVAKIIETGVLAISIVNVVSSQLARLTGHGVYMNSGREIAVASTKSFMNSCVILTEIALWLSSQVHPEDSEIRKKIVNSLKILPMQVGSVIAQNKVPARKIAQELKDQQNMFIIGRGSAEAIVREGALKIKELSQLHTEGFSGGIEKFGPLRLISEGTPVILVILNDEHKERMNMILEILNSRNAKTIVITPDEELITCKSSPKHVLKVQENGELTSLLTLIPMQLIAYYLSIARALDPDHPRNLAKVVTVE
jgi:glucosamine--fructose-6-phosphate aminotransferase (isomerizing)